MCSFSKKKVVATFAKLKNLKKQTNEQTMVPSTRNKGQQPIANHQSATLKPLTHPPIMV